MSQAVEERCLACAQALLAALEGEPLKYKCLITLAMFTGLRKGELVGLQWKDIDFTQLLLHVRRAAQIIANKIVVGQPKRESIRSVALSEECASMLAEYQQAQRVEAMRFDWVEGDWVFTQGTGRIMYPTTPGQWLSKFLERKGLEHMRFHDLRHFNASLLLAAGVDVVDTASRLGHNSPATTLRMYAHALRDRDRQATDKLSALISPK